MNETIFRKKSLERIASPDKLDDYLKVTSPSVWVILAALFIAVIAVGAWCFFGSMPTTAPAVGVCSQTGAVCFLPAAEGYSISPGMKVRITYGTSRDTLVGKVDEVGGAGTGGAGGSRCRGALAYRRDARQLGLPDFNSGRKQGHSGGGRMFGTDCFK